MDVLKQQAHQQQEQPRNNCRICLKVFCCADCRDAHVDSKHPKPQCSLCINQALPYNPTESIKRTKLLSHIVFNHLPLHCKLCGDKYTTSADLVALQACRWWKKRDQYKKQQQQLQLQQQQQQQAAVQSLEETIEKKLPLTPQLQTSNSINDNKSLQVTDLKQNESPLELVRHTSTPMHGIGITGQKQSNSVNIPEFMLKTPSSFDNCTFETTASHTGSSDFESRYYTCLSSAFDAPDRLSILSSINNNNIGENQSEADSSLNSPSYPILKKHLKQPHNSDIASEDEEVSNVKKLNSIIKSDHTLDRISRINDSSRRDSIEKRVRFSDQCSGLLLGSSTKEMTSESNGYYHENDVFFEARESLDDDGNSSDEIKDHEVSSSTPNCIIPSKEEEKKVQCETSVAETTSTTSSSSSSRVVMMLLVEQTDSKGISSLDLAPLISSGLKKLEEGVAAAQNSSKCDNKGSHQANNNNSSGTEVSSKGDCNDNLRNLIKESFVSISSDRVECYSNSGNGGDFTTTAQKQSQESKQEESQQLIQQQSKTESSNAVSCYKSDGIFSVVARVVRCALKKLPAVGSVTSRNLSREPLVDSSTISPSASSVSSTRMSITSAEVLQVGPTCTATASQILLQRSASKRPRERIDSTEDLSQVPPRDSPGNSSSGSGTEMVSSPAAKRHRGWYRIRAREPIARMRDRQLTSPPGTSSETQRFQQGSLTVRDLCLPLPSRAHQSTQTEH